MTDFPDLKFKSLVNFPAAVHGGTGLAVTQDGGVYTFDFSYGELAQIISIPSSVLPTTFLALWESTQDTYRRMSVPDLQTAIGTPLPATAVPLVESGAGAVGVSLKYAREDHVHPASAAPYSFLSITGTGIAIPARTTIAAIQRTNPTTTAITLPTMAAQDNRPLVIVDWSSLSGDHAITLVTPDGKTIMKQTSWGLFSNSFQLASVTLRPCPDLNGWIIAP